jgi:hypothetical protein
MAVREIIVLTATPGTVIVLASNKELRGATDRCFTAPCEIVHHGGLGYTAETPLKPVDDLAQ